MTEVSVVIPVRNEEKIINKTIENLKRKLNVEYEIIVIDDYSSDRTADVVRKIEGVRLIKNDGRPGIANAIKKGFVCATGKYVVPVMGDLCDDPETINQMYKRIKQGYDVVCGSRYVRGGKQIGGSFLKSLFSRSAGLAFHILFKIPTHDITNAFKMYRRDKVIGVPLQSKSFEISLEIPLRIYFSGGLICEVPTIWRGRTSGASKFRLVKLIFSYLRCVLSIISRKIFFIFFKAFPR